MARPRVFGIGKHAILLALILGATGELLRELTLDPSRDYQPQTTKNS